MNGNGHRQESTETSPLLKKDISTLKIDGSLGLLADAPIDGSGGEAGAVEEPENPMFEGLPEVMAKMHCKSVSCTKI